MTDTLAAPAAPSPSTAPAAPSSTPAAAPTAVPQADGDNRAPAEAQRSAAPEIEYEGRHSLDKMFSKAEADWRLDQLAEKGADISVEDLRMLPGADKYTDEQLLAAWKDVQGQNSNASQPRGPDGKFLPKDAANAAAANAAQPPAGSTPAQQRAWKALNGDTEVTDFSKLTADELLKLTFGYNANGKEQRRTFDELVRNAQLGHHNAEKMQTLEQERNTAYQQWKAMEQQVTELTGYKSTWTTALNAAARGNFTPLQTLLDAYVQALDAPQGQPQPFAQPEQVAMQQRGLQVYHTVVMPRAQELAQQYGLPAGDVAEGIMLLVQNEPPEFMTPQKLQHIMQHEIVQHIEQLTASRKPAAPDPRDAEIAALKQQLAQTAQTANTRVEQIHERRRVAPPPNGTTPGGAGTESPNFEGAAGAREWLRNLR